MAFKELSFGAGVHPPITQPIPHEQGFSISNLFRSLAEGWAAYRRHQTLDAMSDRQLTSLGLERSNIGRFAVFGEKSSGLD